MKNSLEPLLADDHASLGELLAELDLELARSNIARGFELLDLFWARLAVHIRAEHLHLFPAIANVPASRFNGQGRLPTAEEVERLFSQLRSDHDFFMKELAETVRIMRETVASQQANGRKVEEVRQRMTIIKTRLETHNQLEENLAYTWPALLFDEKTVVALNELVRRELEKLPPRFAKQVARL